MKKVNNYIGTKVNDLLVLSAKDAAYNTKVWLCQCDCGSQIELKTHQLNSKRVKNCGCKKYKKYLEPGEKFSMLTVEKRVEGRDNRTMYLCQCDCGGSKVVQRNSLVTGQTRSCGCLKGTHRKSLSTEYRTWSSMKDRCLNSKAKAYRYYGGRGIKIYENWIHSFEEFYDYMGDKPGPEFSIERIDCEGNYEPGNVKWATPSEQWANRKRRTLGMSTFQESVRDNHKEISCLDKTAQELAILMVQISKSCDKLGLSLNSVAMLAMSDQRRDDTQDYI